MKKLIILSLLAVGLTNCKNITKEQGTKEEKEIMATKESQSLLALGCYSYDTNNNTVNIEITGIQNGVTGKLTYTLDGKDRNSGVFTGHLNGDKLIGEYSFMSEGIQSKREVAFLVKADQLIEGYGELNEDGTAFVDKNNISYTSAMPLTKTDCNK
ncbi:MULTISPECIES: hypothetical protein [unclassified Arenibacter]|uniref:hypothetical protein n=1 Tax=unclassified Arenibacter TaxID=2615047 RepID=UPI000E342E84|nr:MULTISPECIES: hypothetical protein [unclassified Arenibacter]MCM4162738.1 hypothetical protein [Arenibacter sp. A80]RFT58300.1 hypothetical protein D0S24_03945 [Arenibacter sp. P308M17]